MTALPECQQFVSYMSFNRAILTYSVPADRNNYIYGDARTFLNKLSSLKNSAESESVIRI